MSKVSVPFSLDEKHINFIRHYREGKNISENLRIILDGIESDSSDLARFNEAHIAEENFSPAYQNPRAFLLYQKDQSSVEYGVNLPFTVPKKLKPEELIKIASVSGYRTQTIEYKQYGFVSIWAAPDTNMINKRCTDCKKKIIATIHETLDKLCL